MTLDEQIAEAIKASMPEQVGVELRKLLAEGEEAKKKVKTRDDMVVELKMQLDATKRDHLAVIKDFETLKALETRKEKLDEQERNLKVTMLELELKVLREREAKVCSLVETVFHNPRLVHSEVKSSTIPMWREGSGYVSSESASESRTVTTEETK